jgi:transcription elongation regulator 1
MLAIVLSRPGFGFGLTMELHYVKVKKRFASDSRYGAINSSSYREELFTKFLESPRHQPSEPQPSPSADNKPAPQSDQKTLDKAARQAASLREREEKARRDRERIERMAGRSRMEAGREEAEREFRTLLIDAVYSHEVDSSISCLDETRLTDV